jgi:thymidylate kinase
MTIRPIKYVICEGPDAAGKSTFIRALHKATGFKHNVHDRSFLSMVCYSRQFDRHHDESQHRKMMMEELGDLNNVMVVLLPPIDVVRKRLINRGDEFQDVQSVTELYQIFEDEVRHVEHMPNVVVVHTEHEADDLARHVADFLKKYELSSPSDVGSDVKSWVQHLGLSGKEAQLEVTLLVANDDIDEAAITVNPTETAYYENIKKECSAIIANEIAGINPYNQPQNQNSRRFYYSSDTCISSIHFLPRHEQLKVICTLRSTDVINNASHDTRFLSHLVVWMCRKFGWNRSTKAIELNVNYNSAHVRETGPVSK